MKHKRRMRELEAGFTLIEMLVVIAIIALLVALLLPSIKKARQQTRYLVCAAQQRQIVQAVIGYATDNDNIFPNGYWAAPSIIGQALDVIPYLQAGGMISRDYQCSESEGDAALRVFICPDFPREPGYGWSVYNQFDRAVIGIAPWPPTGWGNVGPQMDPDGSAVHSSYMYVGGVGRWIDNTDGSLWWHGWVAYDAATYASYDDPIDGIGPVLTLGHRARHNKAAILTDRMWLNDQSNTWDPWRKPGTELAGGLALPNHTNAAKETIGGNVGFADGHVEWRWVGHIEERIHAYVTYRPYICY